ncbi:hypothetical protein LINPERHAP1_LOCUS17932 [Linum perenne]
MLEYVWRLTSPNLCSGST